LKKLRRIDPFEKKDHDSNTYEDWWVRRVFLFVPAQQFVGTFLASLKEFPPSQRPASFNLDDVLRKLEKPGSH